MPPPHEVTLTDAFVPAMEEAIGLEAPLIAEHPPLLLVNIMYGDHCRPDLKWVAWLMPVDAQNAATSVDFYAQFRVCGKDFKYERRLQCHLVQGRTGTARILIR